MEISSELSRLAGTSEDMRNLDMHIGKRGTLLEEIKGDKIGGHMGGPLDQGETNYLCSECTHKKS